MSTPLLIVGALPVPPVFPATTTTPALAPFESPPFAKASTSMPASGLVGFACPELSCATAHMPQVAEQFATTQVPYPPTATFCPLGSVAIDELYMSPITPVWFVFVPAL